MKLIIFSDIHGNQYALKQFLKDIQAIQYDEIIFCGDIFGYYYGQEQIIKELSTIEQNEKLYWLKGNHDVYAEKIYWDNESTEQYISKYGHSYENIQNKVSSKCMERISKCPQSITLTIDSKRIFICHGTLDNYVEGRLYPEDAIQNSYKYKSFDYIIYGHTHFKMNRLVGKTRVINSGSLGQQRDGLGFGYAILDTDNGEVTFKNVKYDKTELYNEISCYDPKLSKLKDILERKK